MKSEIIYSFAQYNDWANNTLATTLLSATEEQLNHEIISSFSSIRKTCVHLNGAENVWLQRLTVPPPYSFYKGNEEISAAAEIKLWLETSGKLKEYVLSLTDENIIEKKTVTNIKGEIFTNPVWQMLMHCFNHTTYHRGQLITMLRQVGITTIPGTDLITYYRMK